MYNIMGYIFVLFHTIFIPPLLCTPLMPPQTPPLTLPLHPLIIGHRPQSTQPARPLPGGGIQRTERPINLPKSYGID